MNYLYQAPFGPIVVRVQEGSLCGLDLFPESHSRFPYLEDQTVLAYFDGYFQNPKQLKPIPLKIFGTPFQQNVWKSLQKIPLGETRTYSQISEELNTHPRAIGQACRRNPIPIVIPCHRVCARQGLGGYVGEQDGHSLQVKKFLLDHEKQAN